MSVPTRAVAGTAAVAIGRDLPAGQVLTAADVRIVTRTDLPDGALSAVQDAVGRTLSAAVRRGEIVTDARVVDRSGPQPGPGRVATPVRMADQQSLELLAPGMHVSLIGITQDSGGVRLADDAIVLSIRGASPSGPMTATNGRVVVFAVRTADAQLVASSALSDELTFTFR